MKLVRNLLWLVACVMLLVSAPAAFAQEKTGSKAGFTLKPGTVRIVLMRPTIRVGSQSAGGVITPNAEWSANAREYIAKALKAQQDKLGNVVVDYDEGVTKDGAVVTQYSNLFGALADSVIEYQFFPGNRLPTKKRKGSFEWSLGNGLANLDSLKGADYALFINTYDGYGSAGRKMLQLFAAMGGISVISGVHWGHAGLIDLKTGELVWLNADRQMGGDLRTEDGAVKRVEQLLKGFPGQAAPAAPAAASVPAAAPSASAAAPSASAASQ
ncbi:hypothetical protein [Novosphingobium sp. AAP93]|uniref:hypothetical protein n=1 Tax=Novosphingobium sp. AAP93 TaxID=1523427 RepID=UPI0006B9E011|nr:hypothetical protein [Novosphingobium sp. AAP93]KPF85922.1 hypothetical protein IP83_08005 [Novosphingobium sp. AAP93]